MKPALTAFTGRPGLLAIGMDVQLWKGLSVVDVEALRRFRESKIRGCQ